jgi:Leucine-rich repeat (LRR) protein
MNAENVIQEISRCNSKPQPCDAMHGYHSDYKYDTNGKDNNTSGDIIDDIIANDSNSLTLSNDFPLSFLSEDDKVRLALRTSSSMRPGAYVENELGGINKPTTQEELWKHATYDRRRHEGGEYSSENNRYRQTNAEPACKHDEILGIQRSHESMVRLQESLEKSKSMVLHCFSRKQSWIFAALSIAIIILAISLTLIFTVGRGSHVTNDKDKNGTSSTGVTGYSLFDLNLCYSPDFLNKNNNDKFDRIRLAILTKFQSMENVIDKKYSKESLSLCWLAYFDEFNGKVEDNETELVQRFALAMIYFHFIGASNDSVLVRHLRREKWLDYTPVCEWSFVNCSNVSSESKSVNQITSLEISSMQLQGQLPSELALLSSLSRIHIQPNLLSGSIPEEIWQLSNLEDLSIYENQLSGSFPGDVVRLSRLTNLIMDTLFTGTIPALNDLSNLKRLDLSSSFIEGDFPSILQLSELGKYQYQMILF